MLPSSSSLPTLTLCSYVWVGKRERESYAAAESALSPCHSWLSWLLLVLVLLVAVITAPLVV